MKFKAPHHILLAILGIIAVVLSGCGGNEDLAKELGCPSDSIMANSDDQIVVLTDEPAGLFFTASAGAMALGYVLPDPLFGSGAYTFPYSKFYGPLVIKVQGPFNTVRNNICVVLTSDGYFWDKDYTVLKGSAAVNYSRYVTKTDASGQVIVWWSSELVTSATASTDGVTAGENKTGADQVTASSGAAPQGIWNAGYSVTGCPAGSFGFCP